MNFRTIEYSQYEDALPQSGNVILGQEFEDAIIVYQAFNEAIANYAVENQKFGGPAYSFGRMTWIKPNFLWMMYRSGWASKPNQERILAISMSKTGFEELLEQGVYTSFKQNKCESREAWKSALGSSKVRIQWDPDHGPRGGKLERKAVQIGIKDQSVREFNEHFIREIKDITGFVVEQRQLMKDGQPFMVALETVVSVNEDIVGKYSILNNPQR